MKNNGTIQIETERLILRKFTLEDAEDVYNNWTSDDDVSRYVRWSTHKNIEETREYLKNVLDKYNKNVDFEWGITLKNTGELIGAIVAFATEENKYEIGYNIAKKHWRNGYTTEALKAVMNYLINDVGIKHFICSHAKLNPASGSVMRKVGFKYVKDTVVEKHDKSAKFDTMIYNLDV